MKVTVFFEVNAGAHVVAQFDEESTCMARIRGCADY